MSALKRRDASVPITIGSFDAWPQLHGAWYDDPFAEADLRWWDGTIWTDDVKAAADDVASGASGGVASGASGGAPSRAGLWSAARFQSTFLAALARL